FFHIAERIGGDEILRWAKEFGFAQRTGIDLANEEPGLLPEAKRGHEALGSQGGHGHPFAETEAMSLAIGQGTFTATPLQVAVMMAAIANGGLRVIPHLRSDAFQPPRPIELLARSDPSLAIIQHALQQV